MTMANWEVLLKLLVTWWSIGWLLRAGLVLVIGLIGYRIVKKERR
ncbi:hypothetical protein [Lactiplantibacillus herbarum]|nr:hypothetical protein [Lactiplantibacillus herbarum]